MSRSHVSQSNVSRSAGSNRSWIAGVAVGEYKRDNVNIAAILNDQRRLVKRMRARDSRIRRISNRENGTLGAKLVNAAVAYGLRRSDGMVSSKFEHPNKVYHILNTLQALSGNTYNYRSFKKKIKAADAKSPHRKRRSSTRSSPVATRQRTRKLRK